MPTENETLIRTLSGVGNIVERLSGNDENSEIQQHARVTRRGAASVY